MGKRLEHGEVWTLTDLSKYRLLSNMDRCELDLYFGTNNINFLIKQRIKIGVKDKIVGDKKKKTIYVITMAINDIWSDFEVAPEKLVNVLDLKTKMLCR